MKASHRSSTLAIATLLLLSSCGSSQPAAVPVVPSTTTVTGASNAVMHTLTVLTQVTPVIRPAPLLSVFVNMLLADGANVPVKAAMMGIDAQLKLHALPTDENIDDLYSLLEQFGAVLHVDINDLLNRSENRAQTLDTYAQGLANITERSTRRLEDVKQQLADLKTQQATQRKNVSTISKDVSAAVKAKDYATAQQRQKDLADAQAELTTTESRLKEMQNVQSIFVELLGIAKERIAALDRNREILIAGLKVVDVPGVDDLGVIEGKTRGRTKGFSPFGGL